MSVNMHDAECPSQANFAPLGKELLAALERNDITEALRIGVEIGTQQTDVLDGMTVTCLLAEDYPLSVLKVFVDYGPPFLLVDGDNNALHYAASANALETTKYLIEEKGLPVDAFNNDKLKWTPLHCAAYYDAFDVVKYLVEKGANIMQTEETGLTVLHLSISRNNLEMAEYFIERGADLEAMADGGRTPICVAMEQGHVAMVTLTASSLIARFPNKSARELLSPFLALSSANGHLPTCQVLCERGADPTYVCADGLSAIDHARLNEAEQVLSYFFTVCKVPDVTSETLNSTVASMTLLKKEAPVLHSTHNLGMTLGGITSSVSSSEETIMNVPITLKSDLLIADFNSDSWEDLTLERQNFYANVYKTRWNGTPVSILRIKGTEKDPEHFMERARQLFCLRSPHLVLVMAVVTEPSPGLVLEDQPSYRTLRSGWIKPNYVSGSGNPMGIVASIVRAVRYLHAREISHGMLRPAAVVIGADHSSAMLTDYFAGTGNDMFTHMPGKLCALSGEAAPRYDNPEEGSEEESRSGNVADFWGDRSRYLPATPLTSTFQYDLYALGVLLVDIMFSAAQEYSAYLATGAERNPKTMGWNFDADVVARFPPGMTPIPMTEKDFEGSPLLPPFIKLLVSLFEEAHKKEYVGHPICAIASNFEAGWAMAKCSDGTATKADQVIAHLLGGKDAVAYLDRSSSATTATGSGSVAVPPPVHNQPRRRESVGDSEGTKGPLDGGRFALPRRTESFNTDLNDSSVGGASEYNETRDANFGSSFAVFHGGSGGSGSGSGSVSVSAIASASQSYAPTLDFVPSGPSTGVDSTQGSSASSTSSSIINVSIFSNVDVLETDSKDSQEIEALGHGSFGAVYHYQWRGVDVALKTLLVTSSASHVRDFVEEINMLWMLRHPNCLAFVGICKAPLGVVTEFLPGGDLAGLLKAKRRVGGGFLGSDLVKSVIVDIGRGLAYLHHHQLAHRDLKPENVLLSATGQCKIADFGLAGNKKRDLSGAGTRRYMAPEVLAGSAGSLASDVYAYGVIVFEVVTLRVPFEGDKLERRMQIHSLPPSDNLSMPIYCSGLAPIIKRMWNFTDDLRPNMPAVTKAIQVIFDRA